MLNVELKKSSNSKLKIQHFIYAELWDAATKNNFSQKIHTYTMRA